MCRRQFEKMEKEKRETGGRAKERKCSEQGGEGGREEEKKGFKSQWA